MSLGYDGTYGRFIGSTFSLLIDTTHGFFIDKCYIWKRSHDSNKGTKRRIYSVISITFNHEVLKKKESEEQENDIITWIVWIKVFSSSPSLKQY